MNFEKYVGIPYAEKGRDETGADCWGLVRLIYKNELSIDLPSFSAEYDTSDNERLEDLFAQYKEGWEAVDSPSIGDVVIFKIFGHESHIGFCIGNNQFLHVREGRDSVIESLDNAKWSKRITGFFKYSEKSNAVLNTVPHPLKTQLYTISIVPGTTVTELVKNINEHYNIAAELKSRINVIINGRVIAQEEWSSTIINKSDVIEYRAVAGKAVIRMVAIVALMYFAPYLANYAMGGSIGIGVGAAATATTAAGMLAGSSFLAFAATAGVSLIGMGLINAIAPIRPPVGGGGGSDPGSAERQLMVDGGSNRMNPYGAIPVVLGKVRMTPLLGSNNYLTYENERDSFLSMLLVWGYGPLSINSNTYKIGEIPLSNYSPNYTMMTLDRITEPNYPTQMDFNAIYGKDIDQVNTAIELTCDGNPTYPVLKLSGYDPDYNTSSVGLSIGGFIAGLFQTDAPKLPVGTVVTATFVSNNISSWTLTHARFSNVSVTSPNSTTRIFTGTVGNYSAFSAAWFNYSIPGDYSATMSMIDPGPWFEAATDVQTNPTTGLIDPVNAVTLALHFPQGLRYIKTKGEGAGDSFPTSVNFRVEYSIDVGSTWSLLDSFKIGGDTFKKDAFTYTKTYNSLNHSRMIIRARRETGDNVDDNDDRRYYFQSILQNVTFTRNTKPAIDPVGAKIAKTAFKINATKELNGNIQGISAVVQTWCKIWNGTAWVDGATSNPAALMRYVLEHPANPRKITNADSQINLAQLQSFYNYCVTKGFEYNGILGEARSILEVLRDICAAGRASPALIDGKWTVLIDEPRVTITGQPLIIQHFTPHNSTGFEGSKALPKRPDGLRINYYDEANNYQESEIIVYDVNKNSTNASLFESITLPGITKKSLVIDHAKWHMAQMKLRPEVYTLTSDIEYLVCNRGDRVKVMHDVPMWGLGSGRIKNRLSSTKLELDEDVPMKAGVTYTMRFRSKLGGSITRNLVTKIADGNYTEIDLLTSVTTDEADVLDLFLFGELNQESQDLIVLSIEPSTNNTARLTLVDYGVTSEYNIFTDYLTLSADEVFESQITLPPTLQVDGFGTKKPLITGFVSDESVMERVSKGVFKYNINVGYFNPSELPNTTQSVEVEYDLLSSDIDVNYRSIIVPFEKGSANITDVKEGEVYKIRMRYINRNNKVGNWTDYATHTVVGKINPPSAVTGFAIVADKSSGQLLASWQPNPEADVYTYEIRKQDADWGVDNSDRLFYGDITKSFLSNRSGDFYIKAVDTSGNYSAIATSETFILTAVVAPDVFTFAYDPTITNDGITLSWNSINNSQFDVAYYEVTYDSIVKIVKANSLILAANWLGEKVFTVKTVDLLNNKSTGLSLSVFKIAPNEPSINTVSINQGILNLDWETPLKTSLPIWGYEVRNDLLWGQDGAIFKGSASNCTIPKDILQLGTNNFYIKSIDTSNIYSTNFFTATYNLLAPENVTNLVHSFADTSLTSATITLDWSDVLPPFGLAEYEVNYDGITKHLKSSTITLPANWLGEKAFTVKVVDLLNNKSSGTILDVNKFIPNSPTNFRAQVIDNTIMFYWISPVKTSLPINHTLLKKGPNWNTAVIIGEKKGDFTTLNEIQGGSNIYWIAAVDTDGNESIPVSLAAQVSEPPDFIFNAAFTSNLDATKINAVSEMDDSGLIMPVNTTETWQEHFVNNSWTSPSNQVSANFPIYIQPSEDSGYYEEVFILGSTLGSSRIVLNYAGTIISGSPVITPTISVSNNGTTYIDYEGSSNIYASIFKYVKIKIHVSAPTNKELYSLNFLSVTLDSKQKTDSNTLLSALASDVKGTIVNFNKEFVNVESITVSPLGTTAINAVYEFQDINLLATYSVSSGICTVSYTDHNFITGQKILFQPSTGLGIAGVYTITGYGPNTFTIDMSVINTSGNNLVYPESFRIYLFDSSGNRVNGTASWSVRGF